MRTDALNNSGVFPMATAASAAKIGERKPAVMLAIAGGIGLLLSLVLLLLGLVFSVWRVTAMDADRPMIEMLLYMSWIGMRWLFGLGVLAIFAALVVGTFRKLQSLASGASQ
jgi:hypothetical protein